MFTEWEKLDSVHAELQERLSQDNLDSKKRIALQKKLSALSAIKAQKEVVDACDSELQAAQQQVLEHEDDAEMKELFEIEVQDLQEQLRVHQNQLEELLYPADDLAQRSAYLEIRAGAGGQEAALFAGDLLKMYLAYAAKRGWKTSIASENSTDLGGYKEVVVHITGPDVYGSLRHESGVHRVQRVPQTETSGRVHTSTATVAVMPEAKEVDVEINNADLRIDVFRASGAGGQHVNTTDSAVRITHIPTGVVVSCQDERSQHKNKAKALKVLRARLLAHAEEKRLAEQSQQRKSQVGTGDRAEKIRTYNYPQNRVSDHRINLTLKKLDVVMLGNLDEVVDALKTADRQARQEYSSLLDTID